jgi:hypothetical protein
MGAAKSMALSVDGLFMSKSSPIKIQSRQKTRKRSFLGQGAAAVNTDLPAAKKTGWC